VAVADVRCSRSAQFDEARAYRLRELSQAEGVADRAGVSQRRVSGIEKGDVDKTQLDTLRRYAEAVSGTLRVEIEIEIDGDRYQIA